MRIIEISNRMSMSGAILHILEKPNEPLPRALPKSDKVKYYELPYWIGGEYAKAGIQYISEKLGCSPSIRIYAMICSEPGYKLFRIPNSYYSYTIAYVISSLKLRVMCLPTEIEQALYMIDRI